MEENHEDVLSKLLSGVFEMTINEIDKAELGDDIPKSRDFRTEDEYLKSTMKMGAAFFATHVADLLSNFELSIMGFVDPNVFKDYYSAGDLVIDSHGQVLRAKSFNVNGEPVLGFDVLFDGGKFQLFTVHELSYPVQHITYMIKEILED